LNMLDTETKRRIDTARDILVGKVPDPKSQVEQITIALIYKFMDDMDAEAEELGGKRSFFIDEFEKYGWSKLMASGVGGHEVLNLYAEAITKMNENAGIPLLFRDIFKNAYLPYRNPETLKSFLKIIDDFEYDHSERLGDAFEYLLSVLGSQGDAGQFRTPRHIIDFMVKVVDPKKDETIFDPACGTAGFLISSYKHILKSNTKDGKTGAGLTPNERTWLAKNIKGYDISPDMVRLSLVNLYLHGFTDPHIDEYDALTSEDKWNEYADVILANPPFMSPKGGIKPHKRFSVQSKRSEVLFVDYMAEHLTPNGRAAIIVPEGIIFQSQNAYKQLRKMLVEDYLFAVVSLPAGVFNPYAGVKTSILLLDKNLAKKSDSILFVKIENDGFDLGAQRRPNDKSELPEAVHLIKNYVSGIMNGETFDAENIANVLVVAKEKIRGNRNWNLSGEQYNDNQFIYSGDYPEIEISDFVEIQSGFAFNSKQFNESNGFPIIRIRDIKTNQTMTKYNGEYNHEYIVNNGDLIIGMDGEFNTTLWQGGPALLNQRVCRFFNYRNCLKEYIYRLIQRKLKEIEEATYAVTVKHISVKQIRSIKIPLPPLEIQKEIVTEIEGYQKIIDGARTVVDNYKPHIQIEPEWEVVELGDVCEINPRKSQISHLDGDLQVSFVPMADVNENEMYFDTKETRKLDGVIKGYTYFQNDDVLLAKVTPCFENGKASLAKELTNGIGFGSSEFYVFRSSEKIKPEWIYYNVTANRFRNEGKLKMTGTGGLQRIPKDFVKHCKIPLPPLETQNLIITQIEKEQALVNANKELITIFEQKIKDKIASVWGE